jgi:hypothetical protein
MVFPVQDEIASGKKRPRNDSLNSYAQPLPFSALEFLQHNHNCLTLQPNAQLTLVIEGTIQATGIQIDFHLK